MTGTALNIDYLAIQNGAPVAEFPTGIKLADGDNPAFAIVNNGGGPRHLVSYQTDGVIEMKDWSQVAGSVRLVPGQVYYAGGVGKLATSGSQQVGTAISNSTLRVSIHQNIPIVSQVFPLVNPPTQTLGKIGDFAFVMGTRAWYQKTNYGWGMAGHLTT